MKSNVCSGFLLGWRCAVGFVCLVFMFCAVAVAADKQARIIFAAELPRILETEHGDYAELARLVKQLRSEPVPTFFLFGGDSLGPSTLSSFDRGSHIIDILNVLEPDAMGVAKREFSFYEDELSQRSYEASFPMVASNLFDPITGDNLDGLEAAVIIKQGDIKLGVLSVLSPAAVQQYPLKRINITDPKTAILRQSAQLRASGVDLIVLLYSANFDFVEGLIKDQVIDIALRKNELYRLSRSEPPTLSAGHVNLTGPGEVALLELRWPLEKNAKLQIDLQVKLLKDQQPDQETLTVVKGHAARLEQLLGEEIGRTTVALDTRRHLIRSRENALANIVTDAMLQHTGADIVLINAGNIRGEKIYAAGSMLTRRDIAMELPYRNEVVLLHISGQQLWAALENSLSELELLRGRFAHVAGLQYRFDSSQAVGQRLLSVQIGDEPLDLQRHYKLATFDYLAQGGDGYRMFVDLPLLDYANQMNKLIAEVVVDFIKQQKDITPQISGRVVDVAQDRERHE